LLRHPDQLAALRADPVSISTALAELLRYDAPVPQSTFRYACEPVEIGGMTIPARAQVIICLAATNRDAQRYAQPELLHLGRAEVHHLAFGHATHFCLGAALGRVEGQLALGALFRRFPRLRIAVPLEELYWAHGDGLVLRGLSELPFMPGSALAR